MSVFVFLLPMFLLLSLVSTRIKWKFGSNRLIQTLISKLVLIRTEWGFGIMRWMSVWLKFSFHFWQEDQHGWSEFEDRSPSYRGNTCSCYSRCLNHVSRATLFCFLWAKSISDSTLSRFFVVIKFGEYEVSDLEMRCTRPRVFFTGFVSFCFNLLPYNIYASSLSPMLLVMLFKWMTLFPTSNFPYIFFSI